MAEDVSAARAEPPQQPRRVTRSTQNLEPPHAFAPGFTSKQTRSLLRAYQALSARRVDLVGDYAGNETFLIDGDAILLQSFHDQRLDMQEGLQLLHAVYLVERFLYNLKCRKCRFHIAFFQSSADLCIPEGVPAVHYDRYRLARTAIVRHLTVNLATLHAEIEIASYHSHEDEIFMNYLKTTPPYFLMLHDGATTRRRHEAPPSAGLKSVLLRGVILSFIQKSFNVALINEVEFRDSKVMTAILETRSSRGNLPPSVQKILSDVLNVPVTKPVKDVPHAWVKVLQEHYLTERQTLAVFIVGRLLEMHTHSAIEPALDTSSLCNALLTHEAMLLDLSLDQRTLTRVSVSQEDNAHLSLLAGLAKQVLTTATWNETIAKTCTTCDIADFIDGRLLRANLHRRIELSSNAQAVLEKMKTVIHLLFRIEVSATSDTAAGHLPGDAQPDRFIFGPHCSTLLPFSNSVFDKHLACVGVKVDEHDTGHSSHAARRVFEEISHWHNNKSLPTRTGTDAAKSAGLLRRDQQFMAEMRSYAASLTNAIGKSLEPEIVVVRDGQASTSAPASSAHTIHQVDGVAHVKKITKGGKLAAAANERKQAMRQAIVDTRVKKASTLNDKVFESWRRVQSEHPSEPIARYQSAEKYFSSLSQASQHVLQSVVGLYMITALFEHWVQLSRKEATIRHQFVAGLVWQHAQTVLDCENLSDAVRKELWLVLQQLKLPGLDMTKLGALGQRTLAVKDSSPHKPDLSVRPSDNRFILSYCGPYLKRTFDSTADPRVAFSPDAWQRQVLDAIDKNDSIFVVAPTSAGKTFISFYAMRKVLEADDDGVLVYVAPTKALVNQIAAEIQARYTKTYKHGGGKSVWAIHTRDYRINNPIGAQILVTVPHMLQIMLLAPSNARLWSSRVKCIIFDEIHSIGQAEDGVVWEQLLLMAPCPIIALSATVGNPSDFSEWLSSTQKAIGNDLVTVQHPHRYSDLRKYFFSPDPEFEFRGLPKKMVLTDLGLDDSTSFSYIHPFAALTDKTRGIPQDLALEARDCLLLWNAMKEAQNQNFPAPRSLDPRNALPPVPTKADILKWESDLKAVLGTWLANPLSPFNRVIDRLAASSERSGRGGVYNEEYVKTTLQLLCSLHEQDSLPAILFNYDRSECEEICQEILNTLTATERSQVKSGSKWEEELADWEHWKKTRTKATAKACKAKDKKARGSKDDAEKTSRLDMWRDSVGEVSRWEFFDPQAPIDGYHFADYSKAQASELREYATELRRRQVSPRLIQALSRGIGVHHAGLNLKYRRVVEILFRKRFLRVIIATGTLALGINMPCKTVVFTGDSVYLTALNYRQCAGRAGRRGFDLLGNVVFNGVSRQKVHRLMRSRLPDLVGHFPITTSLVLRLFGLLHNSNKAPFAVRAVDGLLSQPRLFMGGQSFKEQTMHHLRFSIEYLRRQGLLDKDGAPLNLAGLISHLYYTDNSSFAFHALLKEGYFHDMCATIDQNEEVTLEKLMLTMAHLFCRVHCRRSDQDFYETVVKYSSSMVFLPALPQAAVEILSAHNEQTLEIYTAYVQTFVSQHIKTADNILPLTAIVCGGSQHNPYPVSHQARSAFVALSGHQNDFNSIHDLCTSVRSGVYLEEAVIPAMPLSTDMDTAPLNAWLLDFWKHGDIATLERANGVRRSEVWFRLNDFSLILATIVTSLENFLHGIDGDTDVLGMETESGLEMGIIETKDLSGSSANINGVASDEKTKVPSQQSMSQARSTTKQTPRTKTEVPDSWDDDNDSDDGSDILCHNSSSVTSAPSPDSFSTRAEVHSSTTVPINTQHSNTREAEHPFRNVLKAFTILQRQFNAKFKKIWA